MTSDATSKESGSVTVPSGAAHKFVLKLETVRIRLLDRFGEPHKSTMCEIEIRGGAQQKKATNDKGWLEIRCRPGVEYVDLSLSNVKHGGERRVLLRPAWKDQQGTKERLANLGFYARGDELENGRHFQRSHSLDTVDADLQKHLNEIESDYKTLDNPLHHETSALDEPAHDLADKGERT